MNLTAMAAAFVEENEFSSAAGLELETLSALMFSGHKVMQYCLFN